METKNDNGDEPQGLSAGTSETVMTQFGKPYIGTKVIRAEPMSNEDWLRSQGKWSEGQETAGDGYKVLYEDGYYSWSPKAVFERCYREITQQERRMTY